MKLYLAALTLAIAPSLAVAAQGAAFISTPALPRIVITPGLSNAAKPILIPSKPDLPQNAQPVQLSSPTPIVNWDAPPITDLAQLLIDDGIDVATATQYRDLLMKTAKSSGVPVDVLFAAIYQESDYQHYGVNLDYGNYSCGVAQYNISGFCQAVNPSRKLRAKFGWPEGVSCDDFETNNEKIMSPFLTAIQKVHALPDSGTEPADFTALDKTTMISLMPGQTSLLKEKEYQAVLAFGANCSNPQMGIFSMAKSLKQIYRDYLPKELKAAHSHTAWVLADAIYNIGPILIDIIRQNSAPHPWQSLTPQKVIDLLGAIWTKRPANTTNTTTFSITDSDNEKQDVKYFQACVNQRHITHIIQAALPYDDAAAIHSVTEDCGDVQPF